MCSATTLLILISVLFNNYTIVWSFSYGEVVIGTSVTNCKGVWVTSSGQVYLASFTGSSPYSSISKFTVSTSSGTLGSKTLVAGGGTVADYSNLLSATSTSVATAVFLTNPQAITGDAAGNIYLRKWYYIYSRW